MAAIKASVPLVSFVIISIRWEPAKFSLDGSCGDPTDGLEHVRARVSLSKKGRATRGFGCDAGGGIIVRGNEDERCVPTLDCESVRQLDAGHTSELDVEDEAVESRLLRIRQKFLGRGIGDRLKTSGT
jgi:hypothetical protein